MDITVWSYIVYLATSVGLTIWVGQTLHKNGRIFLVDAFGGHEKLADSVNHLLVVGWYLINVGYTSLMLKLGDKPTTTVEAVEYCSWKIGIVLLILGAMHFMNLFVFSRIRRRGMLRHAAPPVEPTGYIAPEA